MSRFIAACSLDARTPLHTDSFDARSFGCAAMLNLDIPAHNSEQIVIECVVRAFTGSQSSTSRFTPVPLRRLILSHGHLLLNGHFLTRPDSSQRMLRPFDAH